MQKATDTENGQGEFCPYRVSGKIVQNIKREALSVRMRLP